MGALNLQGWRPIRVYRSNAGIMVDWARLGDAPLLEPFYQQSVGQLLRLPFHQAFRLQTSLQEMLDWHQESPGLEPCVVTFHVSRCGSTLIPQAFAQSVHHLAFSEPAPVDFLLREALDGGWLTEGQAIAALRAWNSAWAQRSDPQSPQLQAVSLKLDAWNTCKAELIARAWPQAVTLFITREPLSVLASQMQERGFFLVPGTLKGVRGLEDVEPAQRLLMPHDLYCARVLGRIYEDMAQAVTVTRSHHLLIVDHAELPEAIEERVLPQLSWRPSAAERFVMHERLSRHGKRPEQTWVDDTAAKHVFAAERLRELAREWMEPHYKALLEKRAAQETVTEAMI